MPTLVELIERWSKADSLLDAANGRMDCNDELVHRLVDRMVAADAELCKLLEKAGVPVLHAGRVYSLDSAGHLEVNSQFPEAVPAASVTFEDEEPALLRSTRWNYGRSGAACATATAAGSTAPPGGTTGPHGAA